MQNGPVQQIKSSSTSEINVCESYKPCTFFTARGAALDLPCTSFKPRKAAPDLPCPSFTAREAALDLPCTSFTAREAALDLPCTSFKPRTAAPNLPCTSFTATPEPTLHILYSKDSSPRMDQSSNLPPGSSTRRSSSREM